MELDKLRKKIDETDNKIIELVAKRMKTVKIIGEFKKKGNIGIVDSKRQSVVFENRKKKAKALGLNVAAIEKIFKILVKESVILQKKMKK
ncbi:MAG: chorismate mutase [archaeon]